MAGIGMEKPKKYEDRLMAALDFDEDDLDANQAGHFSAAQRAQFAAKQRRIAAFIDCRRAGDASLGSALLSSSGSLPRRCHCWFTSSMPVLVVAMLTIMEFGCSGAGDDAKDDQVLVGGGTDRVVDARADHQHR